MYVDSNVIKSKADLRRRVEAGEKFRIFQPGGLFDPPENDDHYTGFAYCEGPHYPKPHTWYAKVRLEDGIIVEVCK